MSDPADKTSETIKDINGKLEKKEFISYEDLIGWCVQAKIPEDPTTNKFTNMKKIAHNLVTTISNADVDILANNKISSVVQVPPKARFIAEYAGVNPESSFKEELERLKKMLQTIQTSCNDEGVLQTFYTATLVNVIASFELFVPDLFASQFANLVTHGNFSWKDYYLQPNSLLRSILCNTLAGCLQENLSDKKGGAKTEEMARKVINMQAEGNLDIWILLALHVEGAKRENQPLWENIEKKFKKLFMAKQEKKEKEKKKKTESKLLVQKTQKKKILNTQSEKRKKLEDMISPFSFKFASVDICVNYTELLDDLLRLFYGARCVFAHGDSTTTFEKALENFPNNIKRHKVEIQQVLSKIFEDLKSKQRQTRIDLSFVQAAIDFTDQLAQQLSKAIKAFFIDTFEVDLSKTFANTAEKTDTETIVEGLPSELRSIKLFKEQNCSDIAKQIESIKSLLPEGAGINYLHVVCVLGDPLAISTVLELCDADTVNARATADGETPFHCLLRRKMPSDLEVKFYKEFKDKGLKAHQPIAGKCSLLHLACRNRNLPLIKLLIADGAYINANKGSGVTPLIELLKTGRLGTREKDDNEILEIVKEMMQRGAAIDSIANNNNTVLHYAASVGLPKTFAFLKKFAADNGYSQLLKELNSNNFTPKQRIERLYCRYRGGCTNRHCQYLHQKDIDIIDPK